MIDTIENKLYLQPILHEKTINVLTQHIYITSDEEIKEGDWLFANQGANKIIEIKEGDYPYGSVNKKGDKVFDSKHWKSKIILTTDQELIADGVQAIDDEFLEWFVKNPSCEFVWTDYDLYSPLGRRMDPHTLEQNLCGGKWKYTISIPQDEPKQFNCTFCEGTGQIVSSTTISGFKTCNCIDIPQEEVNMFTKGKKYIQQDGVVILAGENGTNGIVITDHKKMWGVGHYSDAWNPKAFKLLEEPKQETLEEVAERFYSEQSKAFEDAIEPMFDNSRYLVAGFIDGARWQAERMYSEEELRNAMNWMMTLYFEFYECPTTGRIDHYIQSLKQQEQ